ncbi:putative pentatricopeptide repeat-containing protein [Tripterygium wilfordii]|uniref:Putative pentatricopeptide repeat-containing protein n=1 Tax=Tripterygium wilfordii TaxID=458696 RepID=A0A7J7DGY6_TRIWF|nr:pentatricopeptide repeat-containing protein At2g15980 [Tripterygium wilfordii]XP_038705465.1 pentatricopeptide repeat-containing protein At2g15980 [Tripterygium wilfordii]XP_038705466.1 pentatricopeptide repeat-containing protein At2g15980 [Tripterygium wilfordii]KAF5745645.1 putative pentatricopeptide repeat-containing protein [Tripterygium wilfordii]
MSILILNRIRLHRQNPKPIFLSSYSSALSPPPSDLPNDPLISDVVSLLSHHRSKSRWTHLLSLLPSSGITPTHFSQIALHLKSNPHLALRFFFFTKSKCICNHNLISLSTIIHILSRARLKTHAQSVIRDAIIHAAQLESDSSKSAPLKVFETLVKTYRECGSAPFLFDLLIKSCLDLKKIDGSIMIMRMLKSKGISPQVGTCNSLILGISRCKGACAGYGVYCEVFGVGDDRFDGEVRRVTRVRPNVQTFNTLMECFFAESEFDMVEEIWAEMEKSECVANSYSYSILMSVFCEKKKMREAENLWKEMRLKIVKPDAVAYNTIIGGFCKVGEIERAEEFLREMGLEGLHSSSVTYDHLVNGYCGVGNVDSAMLVYKDMCRKGFRADRCTMDALIGGLCDNGKVVEALEVMRVATRDAGFSATGKSYELLIKALCRMGNMEEALKLQAEMVGKGFGPNSRIYGGFIEAYRKLGNVEMEAMLRKESFAAQDQQEYG